MHVFSMLLTCTQTFSSQGYSMHSSLAILVFSHLEFSFNSHPCSCLSKHHLSRNEAEGLCLHHPCIPMLAAAIRASPHVRLPDPWLLLVTWSNRRHPGLLVPGIAICATGATHALENINPDIIASLLDCPGPTFLSHHRAARRKSETEALVTGAAGKTARSRAPLSQA